MEAFEQLVSATKNLVDNFGIPVAGGTIPLKVIALIGTGIFLTLRLQLIQLRRLGHGFAVTSGKYDDPSEPGDVSHFQALTTALSATVGIGNIAGAAWAVHWGGPGALFWMWVTALVGMATKFSEVTLAQQYRRVERPSSDSHKREGVVSGGPMYYIERGLGPRWKPLAVFFALILGFSALMGANAVQANTIADTLQSSVGLPNLVTGILSAGIVAAVILGGITRIGKVTGVLAPAMATLYVAGASMIIALNIDQLIPTLALVVREAFHPTAGVAGTGVGALLVTLNRGVERGLFSNEAGQGSAPIAHAAAKTDEPVSEGVVGLVEPFIDTIVIVTMTVLVIVMTGSWDDRVPTELALSGGDVTYLVPNDEGNYDETLPPAEIRVEDGIQTVPTGTASLAWHDVVVERLFTDREQTRLFTGVLRPPADIAITDDGRTLAALYGDAPESGAPLTMLSFRRGLAPIADIGHHIVFVCVLLFGISTAISWSYYGDRCAAYLFGRKAVLPYRAIFVGMHFLGAIIAPVAAWDLGDLALGILILPNLVALVMLSGKVKSLTDSYFERRPWVENAEVQRRLREERRQRKRERKRL
jgi:AGCS family alanine or glycine:cation symporter